MELDKGKENIILEMVDNGKVSGIIICNMEMENIRIKIKQWKSEYGEWDKR